MTDKNNFQSGFSDVNGINMYYEIYGQGKPLVLIHGGGSTIETTFGKIIPILKVHRQIIAVELQAHGRTTDRNTPLSFEQDADDVATLLKNLKIAKADFFGFSNGGQTTIEIVRRHSHIAGKIILASIFYKRSAAPAQFWEGFTHATLDMMPADLQEGFLKLNKNNEAGLLNMFNKDVQRMKNFTGWTDEQMKSINNPALIMNGNHDVGSVEHAVEMYRILPNAQLVILPGSHGEYIGAIEVLGGKEWKMDYVSRIIEDFLKME
jgi:pimeloyl-ACP methyl ester carboxylesterase